MRIDILEKLVNNHGVDHTVRRFDVQIEHLKKAMTNTDESTASVLDDVVRLMEEIKLSIKPD